MEKKIIRKQVLNMTETRRTGKLIGHYKPLIIETIMAIPQGEFMEFEPTDFSRLTTGVYAAKLKKEGKASFKITQALTIPGGFRVTRIA